MTNTQFGFSLFFIFVCSLMVFAGIALFVRGAVFFGLLTIVSNAAAVYFNWNAVAVEFEKRSRNKTKDLKGEGFVLKGLDDAD